MARRFEAPAVTRFATGWRAYPRLVVSPRQRCGLGLFTPDWIWVVLGPGRGVTAGATTAYAA